MVSKFVAILSVVLLPVVGVSAQASGLASPTEILADAEGPSGSDCFYVENRSNPECQNK